MFKTTSAVGLSAVFLMVIAGCAKYKPQPLPHVQMTEKAGISAQAYVMTREECKNTFSRDATKHGLRAVHLAIVNNTEQSYALYGSNISMNIEPRNLVAKKLKISTAARTFKWGFFTGLLGGVAAYTATKDANKALDDDFMERVIGADSECILHPGSKTSRAFFISASDHMSSFSVKLVNVKTQKIETLKVALPN